MSDWYVSPISVALPLVFLMAMYLVYRATRPMEQTIPGEGEQRYLTASLPLAAGAYLVAVVIILGSAVCLANAGTASREL